MTQRKYIAILTVLGVLYKTSSLFATSYTYSTSPTPPISWETSANWSPNGIPGASDTANFIEDPPPPSPLYPSPVLLGANQQIASLVIDLPISQSFTLGGDSDPISGSLYALSIVFPVVPQITYTGVAAYPIYIACPVIIHQNTEIIAAPPSSFPPSYTSSIVFNEPITEASSGKSVTFSGEAGSTFSCTIEAPCQYTGLTIIDNGTLFLSAAGSLASSSIVYGLSSAAGFDISGIPSSSTTIQVLHGLTTVNVGTKSLIFGNGISSNFTFAGTISGSGNITKTGSATAMLSGDSSSASFSTTILQGTIALTSTGAISSTGALTLASGTIFDLATNPAVPDQSIGPLLGSGEVLLGSQTLTIGMGINPSTFSGSIIQASSTTGNIVITGIGTEVFTGPNSYTGSTTMDALSTLQLSGASSSIYHGVSPLTNANVVVNGIFDISPALTSAQTIGTLSGSGTILLGANSLSVDLNGTFSPPYATYGGVIQGSSNSANFIIQGAGGITLTGNSAASVAGNAFSTTISPLINVVLGPSGSLSNTGTVTVSAGGIFDVSHVTLGSGAEIGTLTGEALGQVFLGNNSLTLNTNASSHSFPFSGTILQSTIGTTGNLVVSGTGVQVFAGANSYKGTTTINAGASLQLSGSSALIYSAVTPSDLIVYGTFDMSVTNTPSQTVNSLQSSLANNGIVILGNNTLTIADSSSSTPFYGMIQQGAATIGSLTLATPGAGTNTQYLKGSCTYAGTTTINSSTVLGLQGLSAFLYHNLASPGNVVNNGTFSFLSCPDQTIGALTGNGVVSLETYSLTVGKNYSTPFSYGGTFEGSVSGSTTGGTLVKTGSAAFTLSGNSSSGHFITFVEQGSVVLSGSGAISNSASLSVASGAIFDMSSVGMQTIGTLIDRGSLTSGTVYLGSNELYIASALGTFSGSITQGSSTSGGMLTVNGSSIWTLTGSSSYTGSTTITSGTTLQLSGASAFLYNGISPPGDLQVDGSFDISPSQTHSQSVGNLSGSNTGSILLGTNQLTVNLSGSASEFDGTIQGTSTSASFVVLGNQILSLSGNSSSYPFSTTIGSTGNPSTLALLTTSSSGQISQSGTLTINAGSVFDLSGLNAASISSCKVGPLVGSGQVNLGTPTAAFEFGFGFGTLNSSAFTFSGILANGNSHSSIGKYGAGIETLSSTTAFTYGGGTNIHGGVLVVAPGILPTAGTVTISSGASLNFPSAGAFSGQITGSGSLIYSGSGVLTLTNAGGNNYSGGTTIKSGGTIVLSGVGTVNNIGTGLITLHSSGGTLQEGSSSSTLANNIQLLGPLTFDPQVYTLTSSGNIQGNGSLTKISSGTVVLSGTNSYSGGTTVQAGVLQGSTTAIQGSVAISSGASVNFSQGFAGTYSGVMSGAGAVNIVSGAITFTGQNVYTGLTTVQGGSLTGDTISIPGDVSLQNGTTLIFDMSLPNQPSTASYNHLLSSTGVVNVVIQGGGFLTLAQASPTFNGSAEIRSPSHLEIDVNYGQMNVTTDVGATFSGTGQVHNLTVNGTLIPGDPGVGTIHVLGNLSFSNSGIMQIYVTSSNVENFVDVTGNASLNGYVSVNPQSAPQSSGYYPVDSTYLILQANSVLNSFISAYSSEPGFVPTLSYTATQVFLNLHCLHPFFHFPYGNYNERSVGENINAIVESGSSNADFDSVLSAMVGESDSQINQDLDQMHPAAFGAHAELQAELGAQVLSLFSKKPQPSCSCSKHSRLWVQPFGNWLREKHQGMQVGFHGTTRGVALGYDYTFGDFWTLGVGGAYSKTDLRWSWHRGYSYTESVYGSMYTDLLLGRFCVGATGYFGKDYYQFHRHIQFSTINRLADSSSHALDLAGQLRMSYLFGTPSFFLYPYALVDYLYLDNSSFNESGANSLDLQVEKYTSSNLRAEAGLGFRFIDRNIRQSVCVSPLFSLGYVLEQPLSRSDFISTFSGQTIPFKTKGWNEAWQLLNLHVGLGLSYRCFSLDSEYIADVSPDGNSPFFNQRANFNFKWSF